MEDKKYKIAVIGAGKVGVALGHLLAKKGHTVAAAAARSDASLEKAAPYLPGARLTKDVAEATAGTDIVLITTRDSEIKPTCDALAAKGAISPSQTVIHMCGAGSLDILSSARDAGAGVAAIHPIQSLASVELAIEKLPGSYFGVTAEGTAKEIAISLVQDLGGKAVDIDDKNKALYHAAACIASNYLVTLLYAAAEVYKASGMDEASALKAMLSLVKVTVSNVGDVGAVAALTGPISRGDAKVIKQHLESLKILDSGIIDIYKLLGHLTVEVALKKGTLSQEDADEIATILNDGS